MVVFPALDVNMSLGSEGFTLSIRSPIRGSAGDVYIVGNPPSIHVFSLQWLKQGQDFTEW